MFHLARRVAVRMDIRDLLELQRTLQGYRVEESPADKKELLEMRHPARHGSDRWLTQEDAFDQTRDAGERVKTQLEGLARQLAAQLREPQGDQVQAGEAAL